jgi:hypothetical protein
MLSTTGIFTYRCDRMPDQRENNDSIQYECYCRREIQVEKGKKKQEKNLYLSTTVHVPCQSSNAVLSNVVLCLVTTATCVFLPQVSAKGGLGVEQESTHLIAIDSDITAVNVKYLLKIC